MNITLKIVFVLMQIISAVSSDFLVNLLPLNDRPNPWDPKVILPQGNPEQFTFTTETCSYDDGNAVITLIPENDEQDVFAFFIGGYHNMVTGLFKNNREVYAVSTPGIITSCGAHDFWIRWSSSESWLALGTGLNPGQDLLLLYQSHDLVSVQGLQLSANGSSVFLSYTIAANQVSAMHYSLRDRHIVYNMFMSAENKTSTVFQVLAFSGAYICLTDYFLYQGNCPDSRSYKIILGAEDNSKSIVYDEDMLIASAETPLVLSSPPQMVTFWVSWQPVASQWLIAVGKGEVVGGHTLLEVSSIKTREINTVAFRSDSLQCSEWILTP